MGLIDEFKTFAMKGNVMDMAVGIIIGAAFGGIVKSLLDDVFMPILGKAVKNVDFTNLFIPLSSTVTATSLEEARKQGAVLAYGNFLTVVINFILLAFVVFLLVKGINSLKAKTPPPPPAAPPVPSTTDKLLAEIRDALVRR
jgi:large conductance mechanosensitive channel